MKRLRIPIGMLLILILLCATAYASGTVHTTGSVNIRTGPGISYSSIGTVVSGTSLNYCDESFTDYRGVLWYRVSYKGSYGWISSKYSWLEADYEAPATYIKAISSTAVRKGPGNSYSSYNSLQKGEQVEYLDDWQYDSDGILWYKVRYYSYGAGWVNADKCELVSTGSEGVSQSSGKISGSYVEATGGKSNLRSQPNLNGSIRCTFYSGDTAEYLGNYSYDERGVLWYYIDYDGVVGWVSSRYTTLY